jgi:hypothetical protein
MLVSAFLPALVPQMALLNSHLNSLQNECNVYIIIKYKKIVHYIKQ